MKPKGRRIAMAVTVVGTLTTAMAGSMLWKPLLEQWSLHKLEVGTPEEQETAIKWLGVVGSERCLIRLHEWYLQSMPANALRIGWDRGQHDGLTMLYLSHVGQDPMGGFNELKKYSIPLRAIAQVEHRIGTKLTIASYMRKIDDEVANPRIRIYLSAHIIFCSSSHQRNGEKEEGKSWTRLIAEDPSLDWRPFVDERARAIKAIIPLFITFEDELWRGAVARILLWCGPEAVPGLNDLRDF